ncbi:MAG: hypothetical protein ACP5SH_22775 [Syntrophobacteraceae bacterium]
MEEKKHRSGEIDPGSHPGATDQSEQLTLLSTVCMVVFFAAVFLIPFVLYFWFFNPNLQLK